MQMHINVYKTEQKEKALKFQQQGNLILQKGQVNQQITNLIQNIQNKRQLNNPSQSNQRLKSFDCSIDSSQSQQSHFLTSQNIQQQQTEKKQSSFPSPQMSTKISFQLLQQKQSPLLEPQKINFRQLGDIGQGGKFLKNKVSVNFSEVQIKSKSQELPQLQQIKGNCQQIGRKSYTSLLYEAVDKNHLESPGRQLFNDNEYPGIQIPELKLEQDMLKQSQKAQGQDQKSSSSQGNIIRPVVEQKKTDAEDSSSKQPNQSPQIKQKKHQLQIRQIPSTLAQSYDELLLTIDNKNQASQDILLLKLKEKPAKKAQKNLKLKQIQKFNKTAKQNTQKSDRVQKISKKSALDQELLVCLPILQGYCRLKTEGSHFLETRFVINKNSISFQNFKHVMISNISKIKLVEKQQKQLFIKITYQNSQRTKEENLFINVISQSQTNYFTLSYQLFSQVILRKLLLMKIYINQINDLLEPNSPIKSPQNSPINSPLTLPASFTRKLPKNSDNQSQNSVLLQSSLYKKSTFFNSWQKKFFALTSNSLQLFQSSPINDEKQKPSSQLSKSSQIWTRFQLIYGYLVIKMWQSKIQKIQIGIPLCDFTNSEGKNNWLSGLTRTLVWKNSPNKDQKFEITID